MTELSLEKTSLLGGWKMKKSAITKFIDRSKEIISEELESEKKTTTATTDFMNKEDHVMGIFKGVKEDEDIRTHENEDEVNKSNHNDYEPEYNNSESSSTSTIASDVVITGNIAAKGNLNFDGKIEGDIECYQSLRVGGDVKGNIKASYATLKCDKIVGNVECENLCEVLGATSIKGDVTATNLIVEGSVTGTINAKEKVTLCATAVLEGDCITARLKIEEGAVVKGNIQTTPITEDKK